MGALLLLASEVSNVFPQNDFTALPLLLVQIKDCAGDQMFMLESPDTVYLLLKVLCVKGITHSNPRHCNILFESVCITAKEIRRNKQAS
jgi:hypothetical protein